MMKYIMPILFVHRRYLEAAYTAALASPGVGSSKYGFKLGSVIVYKKRIIAAGFNSLKTNPKLSPFYEFPFCHAEAKAIINLGFSNCIDTAIYVVRVMRDGSFGMACPCKNCMKLIRHVGIKKVIFSTHKGFEECLI